MRSPLLARSRPLAALTCLVGLVPARAQAPEPTRVPQLHAAIASAEHRGRVPALDWLCTEWLPTLPGWAEGLDPRDGFALTLGPDGVRVRATDVEVPAGTVMVGSLALHAGTTADRQRLSFRCGDDGIEDWFVGADFAPEPRWLDLMRDLGARTGEPRTLSLPVLTGHFAGALLDADPRAQLLRLGPALCGDVTFEARAARGGGLHVRGRSDGGLTMPLVLAVLALQSPSGELPSPLALRAFAARDADSVEAARQLGRGDRELDLSALRPLLRGDDDMRLFAIDALVRQRAVDELPRIVAAAGTESPWATVAAIDALRTMWPAATEATREATRRALSRSDSVRMRGVDLAAIDRPRRAPQTTPGPGDVSGDARGRWLLMLLCTGTGLFGLWARERARAAMAARTAPAT